MITYSNEGLTVNDTFISWADVDKGRNAIRFSNTVLVTVEMNYGRNYFNNSFIVSQEEWAKIKERLVNAKSPLFFGELAGKHSDVKFTIEDGNILEETDIEKIGEFHARNGCDAGNFDFLGTYYTAVDDGEI